MSFELTALVIQKRWGSPARRALASVMSDIAADDGGRIFASTSTLAGLAEISKRQVQHILADLRRERVLSVVRRRSCKNGVHQRVRVRCAAAKKNA